MAPSWEDIAKQVVIDGRPADVQSASLGWYEITHQLQGVSTTLKREVKDLEDRGWSGDAYEAWRDRITSIADKLDKLVATVNSGGERNNLPSALNQASIALVKTQPRIPIPGTLIADFMEARNAEISIGVGSFRKEIEMSLLNYKPIELMNSPGEVFQKVQELFTNYEEEAQERLRELETEYQGATRLAPESVGPVVDDRIRTSTDPDYGGVPSPGSVGGIPSAGGFGTSPGFGDTGVSTVPKSDFSGAPGVGALESDAGFGYEPAGSALAGADAGGLTGAGSNVGRISPGSAGGSPLGTANVGGLGGGGIPGGGSLGKPVGFGIGGVPLGPAGAGRGGGVGRGGGGRSGGRGGVGLGAPGVAGMGPATGRGSGAGRGPGRNIGFGGGGMVGGSAGHGSSRAGLGAGDERTSWLNEDEDFWGSGDDAPPSVLK